MDTQGVLYWSERPLDDNERDWGYGKENWVEDYQASKDHPHRKLILEALKGFEFDSLVELGANCGPNLSLIKEAYPTIDVSGIDANKDAIQKAQENGLNVVQWNMNDLFPWEPGSKDIVLVDAALLYVSPQDIERVMKEIDRVAAKGVILVERFDSSLKGEIRGHVWARDYKALLELLGYTVTAQKLTKEDWPTSKNWQEYGYIFIAKK